MNVMNIHTMHIHNSRDALGIEYAPDFTSNDNHVMAMIIPYTFIAHLMLSG